MATRWALPSTGAPSVSPAFSGSWSLTTGADRIKMELCPGIVNSAMTGKGRAETNATNNYSVLLRQFVSNPIKGNQTITGTAKMYAKALESNAAANMISQLILRVYDGTGTTLRGTLYAGDSGTTNTSEWATGTAQSRSFPRSALSPITLTSVNALDGDVIVADTGYKALNTVTTSYTGTITFGDNDAGTWLPANETTTAANNPFLEFSQDIVFYDKTETLVDDASVDSSATLWGFATGGVSYDSTNHRYTITATAGNTETLFSDNLDLKGSYVVVKTGLTSTTTVGAIQVVRIGPAGRMGDGMGDWWVYDANNQTINGFTQDYTYAGIDTDYTASQTAGTTMYLGIAEGVGRNDLDGGSSGVSGSTYYMTSSTGVLGSYSVVKTSTTFDYVASCQIALQIGTTSGTAACWFDDINVFAAGGTPASVTPPAGTATASSTVPGVAASAVLTPPAGAATASSTPPGLAVGRNIALPAGLASAAATAPAISTAGNITLPAATATASSSAPALTLGQSLALPAGAASASSTPPAVSVGVGATIALPGATATASSTPPALSVGRVIALPAGTAAALSTPPVVGAAAAVNPPAGTASASSTAPGVSGSAVTPLPSGAATAGATAPAISLGSVAALTAGTATASSTPPAVAAAVNIALPAGTAAAAATAPAISAGSSSSANVNPPAGTASASSTPPGLSVGLVLSLPAATAAAAATPAAVSVGVNIALPAGTAIGSSTPPAVSAGTSIPINIALPAATATAISTAPGISVGYSVTLPAGVAAAVAAAPVVAAGVLIGLPGGEATAASTAPAIIHTAARDITIYPGTPVSAWATSAPVTAWVTGEPASRATATGDPATRAWGTSEPTDAWASARALT